MTALLVADGNPALGVVVLQDTLKPNIDVRIAPLRQMGLRTIMITGDNRLTAATIAKRAGVDDFLAEATPEAKHALLTRRAKTRAAVWLVHRPLVDQAFGWSSGRVSRWPQPALFAQYSQVRQVSTE
ncbi:MAG TPA: HAD family hydrolase [Stellaceae bacterium]|nr:HAD family hydrolase [Stellaceae bacterium]